MSATIPRPRPGAYRVLPRNGKMLATPDTEIPGRVLLTLYLQPGTSWGGLLETSMLVLCVELTLVVPTALGELPRFPESLILEIVPRPAPTTAFPDVGSLARAYLDRHWLAIAAAFAAQVRAHFGPIGTLIPIPYLEPSF